jgi:hypothetical protein
VNSLLGEISTEKRGIVLVRSLLGYNLSREERDCAGEDALRMKSKQRKKQYSQRETRVHIARLREELFYKYSEAVRLFATHTHTHIRTPMNLGLALSPSPPRQVESCLLKLCGEQTK